MTWLEGTRGLPRRRVSQTAAIRSILISRSTLVRLDRLEGRASSRLLMTRPHSRSAANWSDTDRRDSIVSREMNAIDGNTFAPSSSAQSDSFIMTSCIALDGKSISQQRPTSSLLMTAAPALLMHARCGLHRSTNSVFLSARRSPGAGMTKPTNKSSALAACLKIIETLDYPSLAGGSLARLFAV